jgi:hypothetical protein
MSELSDPINSIPRGGERFDKHRAQGKAHILASEYNRNFFVFKFLQQDLREEFTVDHDREFGKSRKDLEDLPMMLVTPSGGKRDLR